MTLGDIFGLPGIFLENQTYGKSAIEWKNSELTKAVVRSDNDKDCTIIAPSDIRLKDADSLSNSPDSRTLKFNCKKGKNYTIVSV